MKKIVKKIMIILLAVSLLVTFVPAPGNSNVYAEANATVLSGDALNGCKVRIRPAGGHQPLSINKDGSESQNCVHLFVQGKSSQFYLEKKDDDSYHIYFYTHYRDAAPRTSGDCRLDIDNGGKDSGYYEEGRVIHVVTGNEDQLNKRWQFIPQEDGTYYIRNKLSGQYWSLENLDNINANTNKLVQRKAPMKWTIEIVEGDNDKLESVNDYDSRNFTYNGETVKSTNWMGALPGSLKITDISIPGTHDSGACNLHTSQDTMSTQRYYIDELLNAGVRHLDVRTGLDDNNQVRIVHSSCHARNRSNEELTLSETMGWIYDFLEDNPTETVIFQVKVDAGGEACERETFRQLEALAKETNSKIWAGDHVPTLDEVRGKIVIISRLTPDKLQGGNFDITKDGRTLKWALDCHDWKDSYDQCSALTAQGTNYEVWTQDNWNRSFNNKKTYVRATLFGKIDGYTNGTMYRYDRAKQVGKDAWVFNYTSANNGATENPYAISKDIHQWIYDSSDYSKSDRLVCKDTFTGIMAFDFMDGLMATKIYKTNFNRQYITIHGVTADGEEAVDPLTLFVGDESESLTKLKSDNIRQIIRAHFNTGLYLVMSADNGEILSTRKAANQEELNDGAQNFADAVEQGDLNGDLYVHLEVPIQEVEYEVEMPLCSTSVSAEEPGVTVFIDDGAPYEPARDDAGTTRAFITETADSDTAFSGKVKGGNIMPLQIYIAPKWGYRFSDVCSVTSDFTNITDYELTQSGQLKIKATAMVLHSVTHVQEVPATCEEDGVREHYHCDECNKNFFSMKEMGDSIQVEAADSALFIRHLGHVLGEWEIVNEPTETEEGLKVRRCGREGCNYQIESSIPVLSHSHHCTHIEARKAVDCTETGNIEYWVCDQGDNACGRYFSDAACENEITIEETELPAGEHDWNEPTYELIRVGSMVLVTAVRECKNDHSHMEEEMVDGTIEYQAPTCNEDGYEHVSAAFNNEAFHYEVAATYPALGHEWGEGKVILEPTCSTVGECTFSCKRCGETKTEEVPANPDAHITFTEEDANSDTATCTEAGRQTQYEICSLCDRVIETRRIHSEPLGHNWSEPLYEWSEDNREVTATRVCSRDDSHVESEIAKTSAVTRLATCEENGAITYTASFENEAFTEQTKEEEIPATGHSYGKPSWTWSKDHSTAAAKFTCGTCGDVQTVEADVTSKTVAPTSKKDGSVTYTATVTFDGKTYTDTYKETLKYVAVTGLALTPATYELATLTTLQLKATVKPSGASDKTVTWKSSDESIATVDKNGKVTAKTIGTVTITAVTKDGGYKKTCKIKVKFNDAYYDLNGSGKSNVSKEMETAINWVADKKITGEDVSFGTKNQMSRGQFVRFLYRYAGNPKVTKAMSEKYGKQFKDVDSSYTHYKAIVWAVSKGLIGGYSDGTFKPEKPLTRNNVATILWKFAGSPKVSSVKKPFTDVSKSAALAWGKSKKIFTGTKFQPKANCLRGDFAVFLYRYDKNVGTK